MADSLRTTLDAAGLKASIGVAERKPYRGLTDALRRADQGMYADKAARLSSDPSD